MHKLNRTEFQMQDHIAGVLMALSLVSAQIGHSDPPPNDNFTKRILLAGTDILFSGDLSEASVESGASETLPPYLETMPTQTVWWEWAAPQSSQVVINWFNGSKIVTRNIDGLAVYETDSVNAGSELAFLNIQSPLPAGSLSFQAQAGNSYKIQLAGSDGTRFMFRLVATNVPVIIQHPQTVSVTTSDSTMFGVVAAGNAPLSYQWQRKGTNLPGETAPILGLDALTTNDAGEYCVIVTNSFGMSVSDEARLVVTSTDPAPTLTVTNAQYPDEFGFVVQGGIGRRYRIESSTNLIDWTDEVSFPSLFQPASAVRSVIVNSSGTDILTINQTAKRKFIRTSAYHAPNEICINHLKQIRFAQQLFAYKYHLPSHAAVAPSSIFAYFKNGVGPHCPSNPGGTFESDYFTQLIATDPGCKIVPSHRIEEP